MGAVKFDQLIVNAAVSCGITSKPLYTPEAKILIIWNQVVTETYRPNFVK